MEPLSRKLAIGNVLSRWIGRTRVEAAEAVSKRNDREKREREAMVCTVQEKE